MRVFLVLVCMLSASIAARSAEPVVPTLWDANERLSAPDLSNLKRLRFITTVDFPPFNYLDAKGRLTGFNVELARAICTELSIVDRCQIQALPWDELEPTLEAGDGEAIIAGLAATRKQRESLVFSRPYMVFPARFAMRRVSAVNEPVASQLIGKRVGVLARSPHERMLRDYFPQVSVVTYDQAEWAYADLKSEKLDAVFGDGMRLSFWLSGTDAQGCCRFAGGPYLAPEYLGTGLAIAVSRDNSDLAGALNFALRQLTAKGTFAEIYLKHFPVGFF